MPELDAALAALRAVVGAEHVITESSVLSEYGTATFAHENRVRAVVRPVDVMQVREVVRVANRFRLQLHPVSRGRNWGLGSRVPVLDDNLVLDLGRMNRICDFSEELGYVTVEPGVTFRQLTEYLAGRQSQLYAAVIGGPPDASLIGNALERGDGLGPVGERSEQCCALEAVSGRGELIRTGLAPYDCEAVTPLWSASVGPSMHGLLLQSSFAIVTRMTIWLARRPSHFQGVCLTVPSHDALPRVLEKLRSLQHDGILKPNSCALWNAYKLMASLMQYPWGANGQPYASAAELLAHLPRGLAGAPWMGMAALYSASEAHARVERRLLRKALGADVSRLIVFHRRSVSLLRPLRGLITKVAGLDPELLIRLLYSSSPFLGNPTEFSTASAYWRKRTARPASVHPDRDGCGLHWVCTAVPFEGAHVRKHADILERTALEHGLEPNISYLNASPRLLKCFAVIAYDRAAAGEEEAARACHDAMLQRLMAAGYPPLRLGVQSMRLGMPQDPEHMALIRQLKSVFDPNDVIAPGHYDYGTSRVTSALTESSSAPGELAARSPRLPG